MSRNCSGLRLFGWGLAFAGALLISARPAGAQTLEDVTVDELEDLRALLNQTVVTADQAGIERSLAAAATTVVDAAQIALRGWRSLGEVLSEVPGLYVIDDLVLPSVSVRGVSPGLRGSTRIIKVMVDGVTVAFRPDLSAFLGPEFIPMEAISRIEIARGPLSALYGANAFLAVVNVITIRPTEGYGGEAALRGNLVRSNPGWGVSGMVREAGAGWSYWLAASHEQINRSGLSLSETFESQDPSLPRYAGLFDKKSENDLATPSTVHGALRLGTAEKAGELSVLAGLQFLDVMGEFQPSSILTHKSRIAAQNFWSSLRYDKVFSDRLQGWAMVGYSRGDQTRDTRLYLTNNEAFYFVPKYNYSAWNFALGTDVNWGDVLRLRVGADVELDHETVLYYDQVFQSQQGSTRPGSVVAVTPSAEALKQDINDVGVYLQARSVPFSSLQGLNLVGNIRFDKPNLFEWQPSWRVGVAYRVNESLTARVFAGRAFQAPSGVLLFGQPAFGNGDILGNRAVPGLPPVVPQVIHSVEAATAATLGSHISAELGVYAQALDDRISFRPSGTSYIASNGFPGDVGLNAAMQQSFGVELAITGSYGYFTPYLAANAQRTMLGNEFLDHAAPRYPDLFERAGVDLNLKQYNFRANVQARVVGERGSSDGNTYLNNNVAYTLPAYVDLDASICLVDLDLLGGSSLTQIRFAGRNLLDERHFEPGFGGIDIPNMGRTLSLELRQAL